jgi:Fe-S-cluster containining protein
LKYTYYYDEVLASAFKLAETNGYIDSVKKIQNQVPKTKCECCGNCCMDSPNAYFVEFLLFFREFKQLSKEQTKNIIVKTIDWLLLSLKNSQFQCPLIDENKKCSIYEIRPLNCRTWGFESKEQFEYNYENNIKQQNEEFRKFYKTNYDIDIEEPPRIDYCDKVIKVDNRPFSQNDINDMHKRIIKMDSKFVNRQIIKHMCYQPLPVHLGVFIQAKCKITWDEWALLRVQILRELNENNFSKTYESTKERIIKGLNLD